MEPLGSPVRPSRMRTPKLASLPVLALLAAGVLAGCGSGDDDTVATDPAPTQPASTEASSPTASPTVGTYPEYANADYTYTLTMQCFCPTGGQPIAVKVVDGEVSSAEFTGAAAATPVPDSMRLTVNDVIAEANDTTAAKVEVEWPAGQDWPTSVRVDQDEQMADEETSYELADVAPLDHG
jgi:hypothetical protein